MKIGASTLAGIEDELENTLEFIEDLGLEYSYDFEGKVPSGLNILRSENIIQDENQLVLSKVELALNINTIPDSEIAEKLYHEYYI